MILIGRGLDLGRRGEREKGKGNRGTEGDRKGTGREAKAGPKPKPEKLIKKRKRENVEGGRGGLGQTEAELRPVRF